MPTAIARYYPASSGETITTYVEAASQTFKAGDLVTLNSSGQVVTLVASGSAITTASSEKPVGIALRDAQNLAAADTKGCPFQKIDDDTELCLAFYHATPTSAEKQDVVLGEKYGIKNQGGIYVINAAVSGATGVFQALRFVNPSDPATEQYVAVIGKIVRAQLFIA